MSPHSIGVHQMENIPNMYQTSLIFMNRVDDQKDYAKTNWTNVFCKTSSLKSIGGVPGAKPLCIIKGKFYK